MSDLCGLEACDVMGSCQARVPCKEDNVVKIPRGVHGYGAVIRVQHFGVDEPIELIKVGFDQWVRCGRPTQGWSADEIEARLEMIVMYVVSEGVTL